MTKHAGPDKPTARIAADVPSPAGRKKAFDLALDTLSANGRAGLIVVPAEPTHEMLKAGAAAGEISTPNVSRIYKAMLRASD